MGLSHLGTQTFAGMQVEIVDPVQHYAQVMQGCFDFERMRALLKAGTFRMRFDALHAVTGPYATEIFERQLSASAGQHIECQALAGFRGSNA